MTGTSFRPLGTHPLAARALLARPAPGKPVTLESPALEAMTDFTQTQPVGIPPEASLAAANEAMITYGVRLLFVTEREHLLGIVSTQDTLGERPVQLRQQGKGAVSGLSVADLMHPLSTLHALQLADVRHANVGDLLATFQRLGSRHLLVAEQAPGQPLAIRGLFSATQLGRQLGAPVETFERAQTFAQIEAALGG
ncbi:CBS domain-containing protein [Pseudorhodoferax sp.]|uniref:CBS domain-containing protein n=1 Tax=Pseudorhodoferax sp. TaxID=1993553 RepID=UPI002DD6A55A|nr:CBS domain-containing protein [Pseudorhodoferax sp.]